MNQMSIGRDLIVYLSFIHGSRVLLQKQFLDYNELLNFNIKAWVKGIKRDQVEGSRITISVEQLINKKVRKVYFGSIYLK
jgi:hypothetical protein